MKADPFKQLSKELEQELTGNIIPYWMKYTPDHLHGGFYGHVTHQNQPLEKAGKGAIMNARILWTFAAVYRMYGKQEHLEMARRAYDYILDHFMDREFGGVYWEVDHRGAVLAARKQIYAIAFTVYAMSEYHLACGDEAALQRAILLSEQIEEYAFDRRRNGYTEALSREWGPLEDVRLSEKDDNERKTMNTHLHILEAYTNLYRCRKDPGLGRALQNIIRLFLDHFIDRNSFHLNLFFDDNWHLRSSLVSFGHDIECSWLLHEAAEVSGDAELMGLTGETAVSMALSCFEGVDRDGGIFYEYFPAEKRFDTDKHWWPQAEAMVGFFNAYQLSKDEVFAARSMDSWNFIKQKLIDRRYGEWFWSVNREGVPQTDKEKAGFWKCPYHNGRACMEMIRRIKSYNKHNES